MKRLLCTFLTVSICWFAACQSDSNSGGDSPVVPLPSPPIADSFIKFIDFDQLPDGFIVDPVEIDGTIVEGVNAEVIDGEVLLNPGTLVVTSPKTFRQAAVLVKEMSGIFDTTIEGLDADGDLLVMESTSSLNDYYYVRLLGQDNVIRKVRVTALNARVKKLILARPFFTVDFAAGPQIPSTWESSKIITADFNNDTHLDVALSDSASGRVLVIYADGAGGYTDPVTINIATAAVDLVAVDIDGDELTDLLTLGDTVTAFVNTGNDFSLLGDYPAGTDNFDMAAGDFNSDTLPDLAVAASNGLYLLINNGDGTFGAAQQLIAVDSRAVDVRDLNGDSFNDIALGKASPAEVEVLLGDGAANFVSDDSYPLLSTPVSIQLAKFNWDECYDVAVLMTGASQNWQTFINQGDGILVAHQAFQATNGKAKTVVMPDINNDGFDDMAIIDTDNNELAVFVSDLVGNFIIADRIDLNGSPGALAAGDMNEDGRTDFILGCSPSEVRIYENASH